LADTDTALYFAEFTLDPARRTLMRGERRLELRPKSFDVLAWLASHAGRVVTKEELLSAVWPGVIVTEESLTRCVSDIRAALGDADQQLVKTVPRRGYVFAVPAVVGRNASMPARHPSRWPVAAALALFALLLLGGTVWLLVERNAPSDPTLSIVVMQLGSRNGDLQQDYLAEAVTEEITVDLSRIPGAFVIGRSTADTYRGRQADARQIGRELGVRYVLEGGLDRIADKVRLSLQLVDARTGGTLWAERFDGELRDLNALHRRVTGTVAQSLQIRLLEAASLQAQRRPADDLQAQDAALRAWSLLRHAERVDGTAISAARDLLQQAVARDARSAFAWGLLAETYADDVGGRTKNAGLSGASRAEWLRRGKDAADRGYALDPNHPTVLGARAWILALQGRGEEALPMVERHLQINRNNATAWFSLCYTLATLGRQEEAIGACQESIRLSPRDSLLGGYFIVTAAAHYHLGHDAEALAWARKSVAVRPTHAVAYAWVAAAAAELGEFETAHNALAEVRRLLPHYTVASFRGEGLCANALCEQQRERFYMGLRRAGLAQ
jgi:TolB-like protein/DNA-binding winged helix-turn-helix (wHTH) protein/cytochrome c-type biogenesis protein CcmH/NrfG